MTDKKPDGGPAFPVFTDMQPDDGKVVRSSSGGMTMRDWFAGQALTGLVAYSPYGTIVVKKDTELVSFSYRMADAMLAERDK